MIWFILIIFYKGDAHTSIWNRIIQSTIVDRQYWGHLIIILHLSLVLSSSDLIILIDLTWDFTDISRYQIHCLDSLNSSSTLSDHLGNLRFIFLQGLNSTLSISLLKHQKTTIQYNVQVPPVPIYIIQVWTTISAMHN